MKECPTIRVLHPEHAAVDKLRRYIDATSSCSFELKPLGEFDNLEAQVEAEACNLLLLDDTQGMASLKPILTKVREVTRELPVILLAGEDSAGTMDEADCADIHVTRLDAHTDASAMAQVMQLAVELAHAKSECRQLQGQLWEACGASSLFSVVASVSHKLSNLMTIVMGNLELIRGNVPAEDGLRGCLDRAETAAGHGAELSSFLLDYAHRKRPELEAVDIVGLIRKMSDELRAALGKHISLDYDLVEDLPQVKADAAGVRKAIMCLVDNAIHALKDKGADGPRGCITISSGAMHCGEDYLSEAYLDKGLAKGTYVYVEVTDTGCGMEPDRCAALLEETASFKVVGRGHGLPLVLATVRRHKGGLKVFSERDKGTTVTMLFPARERRAAQEPAIKAHEDQRRAASTILLVDDEEPVRSLGVKMLEKAHYTVLTAADGCEAVDLFRQHEDDILCVLLDMIMPNMDGAEAFEEICQIRDDACVIVASGCSEEDMIESFPNRKPAGFIKKPFRFGALKAKIEEVIH